MFFFSSIKRAFPDVLQSDSENENKPVYTEGKLAVVTCKTTIFIFMHMLYGWNHNFHY